MKQFKDPIYGYVDVNELYLPLIDTQEFQRLRNIRQTGYGSLYPSALHNRFVHSIGVFHLGRKAFSCLKNNVGGNKEYYAMPWEQIEKSFLFACLLHDVGHSPFSHTGEEYYKKSTRFEEEFKKILPNALELHEDIKTGTGKPHEAMSALVGLRMLRESRISELDEELFVRSIIGVPYRDENRLLENTVIGMLNGSLIDVDKLDYLIRDSYVTGFNTMALDVDRLFAGYTIVEYVDSASISRNVAAYKRGSLSVIENVTFANDLERHWIQNNPTIWYEVKLVQQAIELYDSYMLKKYEDQLVGERSIFTQTALSPEGYTNKNVPLRLLCDDDIICFMKNIPDEKGICNQFFDRAKRLKPLWKSETEFRHLENEHIGQGIRMSFKNELKAIKDIGFAIDHTTLESAEKERERQNTAINSEIELIRSTAERAIKAQDKIIKVFRLFKQFATDEELDFDFAFVFIDSLFESNYVKLENSDIYISFAPNRVIPLKNALAVKGVPADEDKGGYYYLYTSKANIQRLSNKGKNPAEEMMKYISRNWNIGN